jgi:putative iron-dependent peroxidase
MATPQPGIFALGTRSHHHMQFVVPAAADAELEVTPFIDALAQLRAPALTAGGVNVVLGFGPALWRRLASDEGPADLPQGFDDFAPIEGPDGIGAPATPDDLWVWIHGTGTDVVLDIALAVDRILAPVADLRFDQPCFTYRDSRDLTGFIDGTANPPVDEALALVTVPEGAPGAGGAFVLTQKWIHDLGRFGALSEAEQEAVIGRTKPDSRELEGADKPADAHIGRVEIHDAAGEELPIFRRSSPYGTVTEAGLYFLAFGADQRRFLEMLSRMFGTSADGVRDRLTDFSRPVTGSFFFAPSVEALHALLPDADPQL